MNEEVDHSTRQYWPIRNDLAMTDGIAMEGNRIIISFQLQKQLHTSHTETEEVAISA